jgi:hypothetical protein
MTYCADAKLLLAAGQRDSAGASGPFSAALRRLGLANRFRALPCATEGEHMATSAGRMRALREREHRGPSTFTIGVSEDDLRVIAEHGYGGAASTDPDQQAQAVSLFITNCSPPRSARVTALRRSHAVTVTVSPPLQGRFSRPKNSSLPLDRRPRPRQQAGQHPAPVLTATSSLSPLRKPVLIPTA